MSSRHRSPLALVPEWDRPCGARHNAAPETCSACRGVLQRLADARANQRDEVREPEPGWGLALDRPAHRVSIPRRRGRETRA
jgi:hypothetical protein